VDVSYVCFDANKEKPEKSSGKEEEGNEEDESVSSGYS
jgi:hypothetical protein